MHGEYIQARNYPEALLEAVKAAKEQGMKQSTASRNNVLATTPS